MQILDLNGNPVEISDLSLALMQVDDYRHYRLGGKDRIEFNNKQSAYWEDFYQKLLKLQTDDKI